MLDIEAALEHVLARCTPLPDVTLPAIEALGRVLAEDIRADVDSPPHDKALVDGFAFRAEDAGQPLRVLEQVVAGDIPTQVVVPGTCSQVMTGAPVPTGADTMVMVEQTQTHGEDVSFDASWGRPGNHIQRKQDVFAEGDVVLARGQTLRAIDVGLLSEVGRRHIRCFGSPQLAVLPTGNELVPCDQPPQPGTIRNSNGPMLTARAAQLGCAVHALDPARDDPEHLQGQIRAGLDHDILVLSGGVSAGVLDLVPQTLSALGVREVFHKVQLKPGKPLWFGSLAKPDGGERLVFGLPGNPVSSWVCFELFVVPAIARLQGGRAGTTLAGRLTPMRLATDFSLAGNRPTFFPGRFTWQGGSRHAEPLPWRGSADMVTVTQANCLIYFPAGKTYPAGSKISALVME